MCSRHGRPSADWAGTFQPSPVTSTGCMTATGGGKWDEKRRPTHAPRTSTRLSTTRRPLHFSAVEVPCTRPKRGHAMRSSCMRPCVACHNRSRTLAQQTHRTTPSRQIRQHGLTTRITEKPDEGTGNFCQTMIMSAILFTKPSRNAFTDQPGPVPEHANTWIHLRPRKQRTR